MDFKRLEYIIRLSEKQILNKVAEEFFISPSALSQSISNLEKELGTPLFKRVTGSWPLTAAGEVYIKAAKDMLKLYKQMQKNIDDIVDNKGGTIKIGISSNKASKMFATIFPKFKEKYPNIMVSLVEGNVKEMEKKVSDGKLDLLFATTGLENSTLHYHKLLHEQFILSVPKNHRLAYLAKNNKNNELNTIDLQLFKDEYFMLANKSMTSRMVLDELFSKVGFEPKVLVEVNSSRTLNNLVEIGYSNALIPMGYMSPTSQSVYFFTNPHAEWYNTVAYAENNYLSVPEKFFIQLAEEYYS